MKILILDTGSYVAFGGAEAVALQLLKHFAKDKKNEVTLFGNFGKAVYNKISNKPLTDISFSRERYDVVIMNSIRDVQITNTMPKIDSRFIFIDHGNILFNHRNSTLQRLLPKMIMRRFYFSQLERYLDTYIALNDDQYKYGMSKLPQKIKVKCLPINAIAKIKKYNIEKDDHALYVGRIDDRQKNIRFLIDGVELALQKYYNTLHSKKLLCLIGDGPDYAKYSKEILNKGLEKNILFTGRASPFTLKAFYNGARFFVSASKWESWGRTTSEALSVGLPVLIPSNINPKISDKESLIKDEVEGKLYKQGDLEEFANKFYRMHVDDELIEKMSKSALKRSKQFSEKKMLKELDKIVYGN